MSQNPPPLDTNMLRRILIVGAVMAVVGIVLFMLLWLALGSAGIQQFPRLILSMCVPPAVIALFLGGYFLVSRR